MPTINSIEYATRFTGELDKILTQKSVVGFLADNAFRAKFVGAKTVKVPSIDLQGLGDYDRDNGFLRGSVSISNTAYTLTQDRARSFQIDREDMDESGVANLSGQVMSEFVRTKVAPETDAYVISKLAGVAFNQGHVLGAPSANSEYGKFLELESKVQDIAGFDEELVAFVDAGYWAALKKSSEVTKYINVSDFKQGDVTFKVNSIDGVAIFPVSSARMKTAYVFATQDAGGFSPASNAKDIKILMMPKKAAMLVKKSEKVRVFTPDQNLKADAYKFDYRIYYDVFVKSSYLNTIYAAVDAPTITISTHPQDASKTAGSISGSLSVTATASDSSTPTYQWYKCDDTAGTNPVKISGATSSSWTIDTTLTAGSYYYFCRVIGGGYTVVDSHIATVTVAAAAAAQDPQ